jgi:hypothetical protein
LIGYCAGTGEESNLQWVSDRSILSEQPYPIIGADLKKNGYSLHAFLDDLQIFVKSNRLEHCKGSQLVPLPGPEHQAGPRLALPVQRRSKFGCSYFGNMLIMQWLAELSLVYSLDLDQTQYPVKIEN